MFVYLTGNFNGVTDIDRFREIEVKLRKKGIRVNNLINVSAKDDKEYIKVRMKNVLKVDKLILVENYNESNYCKMEIDLANYCSIPIEEYKDDKDKY
jgi:hypothetical protein